jgi:glycosyltransferase involved in cell wall biosynthesis
MGIPVITNAGVGDVENIVTKYQAGIVVKDFSKESFREAVNRVISGHAFNPVDIRNGAKDFYALDKATESYLTVYKTILEQAI